MKFIKRYLPILVAVIILGAINSNILKQQHLIKTGKSIVVELAPVDPRSLIQGDYMILNYDLHWDIRNEQEASNDYDDDDDQPLFYSEKKLLKVTLDDNNVVIKSELATTALEENQYLLTVKSDNARTYYPASNTFLFAEGLAYCYDNAKYAEFKVKYDGSVLLYDLLGENLAPLNCEAKERDKDEKIEGIGFDGHN